MPLGTHLSKEEAARFSRYIGHGQKMMGAILTPTAGNQTVHLSSVAEVEEFLSIVSLDEISTLGKRQKIRYVDIKALATWVRDIVGDAELAETIDSIRKTDRVYGLLVPDVKNALAERLGQYRDVLPGVE